MICNVISTGSKGNAVILNGMVLVDCGVPFKLLEPYIKGLKLVLLTHIHGDHFNPSTLRRLHEERPTLRFGCCWWLVEPLIDAGIPPACIDLYDVEIPNNGYWYLGTLLMVQPFKLFHDVENCGYKIHLMDERVIYATDTNSMDGVVAKDYDLYLIEANHTEQEIAERIQRKIEAGKFVYEYRAAAGHLSREKANAWLSENAIPGKSKVIYLHQHREETSNEP